MGNLLVPIKKKGVNVFYLNLRFYSVQLKQLKHFKIFLFRQQTLICNQTKKQGYMFIPTVMYTKLMDLNY